MTPASRPPSEDAGPPTQADVLRVLTELAADEKAYAFSGYDDAKAVIDWLVGEVPALFAARSVSGGSETPSEAQRFAAMGWNFATIEEACAELDALSGMCRMRYAERAFRHAMPAEPSSSTSTCPDCGALVSDDANPAPPSHTDLMISPEAIAAEDFPDTSASSVPAHAEPSETLTEALAQIQSLAAHDADWWTADDAATRFRNIAVVAEMALRRLAARVSGDSDETARPRAAWHDDVGPVLWWKFPITEPPYSGTPSDDDFPEYMTHWTRIRVPATPSPGSDQ